MYQDENAKLGMRGMGEKEVYRGENCVTERTTEVKKALDDLNSVIQRYDHIVGRLGSRLSCVVSPAPPTSQGIEKAPHGYQTDLANHINGLRCTARDITDNLESLLERIEL